MKKFFEKSILILIISSLIFSGGVFIKPQKAEAVVLTSDIVHTKATGVGVAANIGGWAKDVLRWIEDNWQKMMRDIIAKRIINYIVNENIKWIQGGGVPKFIGNWEGFVKDVGDIAFDSVIRETPLKALCSPFGLQIKIGLLPVDTYSDRITCTLDQVVSNIENFYVDFSVGGWRGYNEMWKPQNNYYGVAINIADEIVKRTSEKAAAATSEGLAGAGFMGDKVCKAGSGKDSEINHVVSDPEGGNNDCSIRFDSCLKANFPEECEGSYNLCMASAKGALAKTKGYKTDRGGEYCDPKDLIDANPGSIIGKSVGEAITSDIGWAQNIQSWVSALINAAINRVIKEGVLAMQEITSDKKDSYYPPEYQSVLAQESERDKQDMEKEIQRFPDEWHYLLNVKSQSLSYASSTKATLEQVWQIQLTAPPRCEPPVIIREIQAVQLKIDRLNNEIRDLQMKIDAANKIITQINEADFFDEFQKSDIQMKYRGFINQYGTTAQLEEIVSGSARQAADAEKEAMKTALDNLNKRLLDICPIEFEFSI